jgi:hypothetical protein
VILGLLVGALAAAAAWAAGQPAGVGPAPAAVEGPARAHEKNGHHKVRLGDEEWRRVAAWSDLNAVFYGSNDRQQNEKVLLGQAIPTPELP